ncbi:hypothetical protein F4678DRAFT_436019 [Xylaria arbuscula]|nr:hypothetical protein F4678DRAFT_436019 [Xylaria arbuscula]
MATARHRSRGRLSTGTRPLSSCSWTWGKWIDAAGVTALQHAALHHHDVVEHLLLHSSASVLQGFYGLQQLLIKVVGNWYLPSAVGYLIWS